jgi:SsrA-binding protein
MARTSGNEPEKNLVTHRRATFDYYLEDRFEAGIALRGTEVKSLREGKANLQDAWVRIDGRNAFLVGCHISPYEQGNRFNHEPLRERQLLLHAHEIFKLRKATTEKGLTLVPVRIYLKGSKVKVEVAIGRGKKSYDKRESIKEREATREMARGAR